VLSSVVRCLDSFDAVLSISRRAGSALESARAVDDECIFSRHPAPGGRRYSAVIFTYKYFIYVGVERALVGSYTDHGAVTLRTQATAAVVFGHKLATTTAKQSSSKLARLTLCSAVGVILSSFQDPVLNATAHGTHQ